MEDPKQATRQQIEQAIVSWRSQREARLEQEKIAEALKAEETKLKNFIITAMLEQQYEGTVVGGRQTKVRAKIVPAVEDRAAFSQYILDTGQLDLLQFRISTTAISDRQQEGTVIPGLGEVTTYELSDTKA